MAYGRYFGYRRYRRYRKYRRFYRRYGRGRSYARKYVNASSRSSCRMKTTVTYTTSANAGYGSAATDAVVKQVRPLDGASSGTTAAASPLYKTYCSLYEECKVVGVKVNLSVVSPVGGSDIPSLQIFTAWDRKHGQGEPAYTVDDIKNSSTSNIATALNNNVAKLSRSCYASDLMEKATWFDATLDSANGYRNVAWNAAGLNPNMFCPSFFFFFNCPSLGAAKSVSYSLSITYYFAFRNPRFGGGGSSAKDMPVRVVAAVDAPVDMEDGDVDLPELDLTAEEIAAKSGYQQAWAELEKRRASQKAKRAATAAHVPVTKTV